VTFFGQTQLFSLFFFWFAWPLHFCCSASQEDFNCSFLPFLRRLSLSMFVVFVRLPRTFLRFDLPSAGFHSLHPFFQDHFFFLFSFLWRCCPRDRTCFGCRSSPLWVVLPHHVDLVFSPHHFPSEMPTIFEEFFAPQVSFFQIKLPRLTFSSPLLLKYFI